MAFSMHYRRNSWVIPACVKGISIISLWSAKYWPVRISMDDHSGVTHTTQIEKKSHCYRPPHTWMNELHFLNIEWRIIFFSVAQKCYLWTYFLEGYQNLKCDPKVLQLLRASVTLKAIAKICRCLIGAKLGCWVSTACVSDNGCQMT